MADPTTPAPKDPTAAPPATTPPPGPAGEGEKKTTPAPQGAAPAAEGEKTTTPPKEGEGTKPKSFVEGAATKEEPKPGTTPPEGEAPTFKLPEGVKADEPLLAAFTTTVKDLKLSGEAAQKLVDTYAGVIAEKSKAEAAAWAKTLADNRKALEAHPEIGGTNLEASQADARRAIAYLDRQHGGLGARIVAKMERLGLGDDPDVAHFLTLAGREMAQDKVTTPSTTPEPAVTSEDARMAKRYPTIKGIQPGKAR